MSRICKKGYMDMEKWIYLEPLKSVLGRSILHYSQNWNNHSQLKTDLLIFSSLISKFPILVFYQATFGTFSFLLRFPDYAISLS